VNLCFSFGIKSDLFYLDWTGYTRSSFQRPVDVGASIAGETAHLIASFAHQLTLKIPSHPPIDSSIYTCIDPTCGSGTLLFERAYFTRFPFSSSPSFQREEVEFQWRGMDCSITAHQACLTNQKDIKYDPLWDLEIQKMTFFQKDSQQDEAWIPFDQALMNLPFGLRVDPQSIRSPLSSPLSLDDLYTHILTQAKKWMKPHGSFVIYSTHFKKVNLLLKHLKLKTVHFYRIKSGGLEVGLWGVVHY
jgi:23S rRNA G2445 N2-methylase RlmL